VPASASRFGGNRLDAMRTMGPRIRAVALAGQGGAMGWVIVVLAGVIAGWLISRCRRRTVSIGTVGLLYRNGKLVRELKPGVHFWIDMLGTTSLVAVSTTRIVLPGHELTVMTKDQFSFRLCLTPICEIIDARLYHESQPAEQSAWSAHFGLGFQELSPTLNSATIRSVAQHTLDDFLADPGSILPPVIESLGGALPGGRLLELLITSINMPPEVRKMFTEVERAKREGMAALERARGETASLRALANAARSLQSNPHLAQLRMLQAMESAKGNKTFILGQGDASLPSGSNSE
jgi:regulator of protease activity HflC (stomatin/prohibitin superfamily)